MDDTVIRLIMKIITLASLFGLSQSRERANALARYDVDFSNWI
jgi:hypothetical protein